MNDVSIEGRGVSQFLISSRGERVPKIKQRSVLSTSFYRCSDCYLLWAEGQVVLCDRVGRPAPREAVLAHQLEVVEELEVGVKLHADLLGGTLI